MGLDAWIKTKFAHEQITWDELWLGMASMVAMRSRCSRDRVGAVIVSGDNRMLAVGYNGPPAGYPTRGWCIDWCPRAQSVAAGEQGRTDYLDCPSIHAESNAILRLSVARERHGSTLYVNSAVCVRCALLVANADISRVVIQTPPAKARERNLDESTRLLMGCGVEVIVIGRQSGGTSYRGTFIDHNGIGPHACYFCGGVMPWLETVHHKDHDHTNDDPNNLAPAHSSCHTSYHTARTGVSGARNARPGPRVSVTTKWQRRKPILTCVTCGAAMTPGWLRRHCETYGHDDGGQLGNP